MTSETAGTSRIDLASLVRQFAFAGILLLALNSAIAYLGRNAVPRQLLRRLAAPGAATDVFFGNSLIAAGIDESTFDHATTGTAAFNAGLGATQPIEHYLLMLARTGPPPRRVYYGFFDDQLTTPVHTSLGDLFGNRAMVFYVHPDTAAVYLAPTDPAWRMAFRIASYVPMYVERGTLWSKAELMRRRLSEYGAESKRTNQFGRAEDFSLLEAPPSTFEHQIDSVTSVGCRLTPALDAAFARVARAGSQLIIVKMPMPTKHRATHYTSRSWDAYERCVREQAFSAGAAAYIDAASWVPDSEFADPLHLAPSGARRFSAALAHRVMSEPAGHTDQARTQSLLRHTRR